VFTFKNLTVFRLAPGWSATFDQIEAGLDKGRFAECGATQEQSAGWVPPRGPADGPLAETVRGQWLMRLMVEQRVLPGAVVKRRIEEIAAEIERTTGRKPGRKQTKELKDQATLELLPMAFTKRSAVNVWVSPDSGFVVLDTSSPGRADEVVTLLVKALDGVSVQALHTEESPVAVMADWLLTGEPAADFTVDRECELKSGDEMKSVVRYARHPLDIDEVRQHITQGKMPTRLAMTWNGRVSFVLTEGLQLRKIEFLDGVLEVQGSAEERFDADVAIVTTELTRALTALIEALGGEHTVVM
jgi:recombination associated protein RdgC